MGYKLKTCLIVVLMIQLLQVQATIYQFGEPTKQWLESLRKRCEGSAEGTRYFDSRSRRCCICSPCAYVGHMPQLACTGANGCTGRSMDCVSEPEFDKYFPILTTAIRTSDVTPTTPEQNNTTALIPVMVNPPSTSPPSGTTSETVGPSAAPAHSFPSFVTTIAFVFSSIILLVVVIYCVAKNCPCFKERKCVEATMTKIKQHFQKSSDAGLDQEAREPITGVSRQESSQSSNMSETSEKVEEEKLLDDDVRVVVDAGTVDEKAHRQNLSPKRERHDSKPYHSGKAIGEYEESRSIDDNKNPIPSNDHYRIRSSNYVRPDIQPSFDSARDPVGLHDHRQAYVVNQGPGHITINNMTVVNRPAYIPHSSGPAYTPSFVMPPGRSGEATDDPYVTQTPTRDCYPIQSGRMSCVTSKTEIKAHPTESAPTQHDEASGGMTPELAYCPRVRRQSSNFSSTSTGAVENELADSGFTRCSKNTREVQVHGAPQQRTYAARMPQQETARLHDDTVSTISGNYGHSNASRHQLVSESRRLSGNRHEAIVESQLYPGTARAVRAPGALSTAYEESENTYDLLHPPEQC